MKLESIAHSSIWSVGFTSVLCLLGVSGAARAVCDSLTGAPRRT